MSNVRVPEYLDLLAAAGIEGLPIVETADAEAIEVCRSHGIDIQVDNGRGRLFQDQDVLVPLLIKKETAALAWEGLTVEGFFRTESTNDHALDHARRGAPAGLLVYAEHQTAGRGRLMRKWISLARAGLYFSLLVRPTSAQETWPLLTHVASVALIHTLNEFLRTFNVVLPIQPGIKWPNDVLLSGKKTAGILLETACGPGRKSAVIVGVGINLRREAVPPGLGGTATAIGVEARIHVPRRWLLVHFLGHFQKWYLLFEEGDHAAILREWKRHSSMWDGTPVQILENGRVRRAVTCGLSETGALRIRNEEGGEETVVAADVSVRPA